MMDPSRRQGWGRSDELGTWAPVGGSGGEKELIRLPNEAEKLAPIAGTLTRSRINKELRGYYGLAASLAGNHKPTQAFIVNMMAAGLGEGGFARNEFLMGLARMLVPTAMPTQHYFGGDGRGRPPESTKRTKKDEREQDE